MPETYGRVMSLWKFYQKGCVVVTSRAVVMHPDKFLEVAELHFMIAAPDLPTVKVVRLEWRGAGQDA